MKVHTAGIWMGATLVWAVAAVAQAVVVTGPTQNWHWAVGMVNTGGATSISFDYPSGGALEIVSATITNPCTIDGMNRGTPVTLVGKLVLAPNSTLRNMIITDWRAELEAGDNVSVVNCTLGRPATLGANAMFTSNTVQTSADITLAMNATVNGCHFTGGRVNGADGVSFLNSSMSNGIVRLGANATVQNIQFQDAGSVRAGADAQFIGNYATNGNTSGRLEGGEGSLFTANRDLNIQLLGSGCSVSQGRFGSTTLVGTGSNHRITGCVFEAGYARLRDGQSNEVVQCEFLGGAGLMVYTQRALVVHSSTFSGCATNGLHAQGDDMEFHGNAFLGNGVGLFAEGSDIHVHDSRFEGNQHGLVVRGTNVVVGGNGGNYANRVFSNMMYGVVVSNSLAVQIKANYIGCEAANPTNRAHGNGMAGVAIFNSSDVAVGMNEAGGGNWITFNGAYGIYARQPGEGIRYLNNRIVGSGAGVYQEGGSSTRVMGNYVGTTAEDAEDIGNGVGLWFRGAIDVRIGSEVPAGRNIISGNLGHGILLRDCTNSHIVGNFIGTVRDGNRALPNYGDGIRLDGAHGVWIGGESNGARNIISGNAGFGVNMISDNFGLLVSNVVYNNFIGTDTNGLAAIANVSGGVQVNQASCFDNRIGGPLAWQRNLISGNGGSGVWLVGGRWPTATAVYVQGNFIGTDPTGSNALPNAGSGIGLGEASDVGSVIGGTNDFGSGWREGNVISGNGEHGIAVSPSNGYTGRCHADGNFIGTDASGRVALPNARHGIAVAPIRNNDFPGAAYLTAGEREGNVIAGNAGHGIYVSQGIGPVFKNNRIGVNADGDSALPNGGCGVVISSNSYNVVVGGRLADEHNVIAGNAGHGVLVHSTSFAAGNRILGNYIGFHPDGNRVIANGGDGIHTWSNALVVVGEPNGYGNIIDGCHGVLVSNAAAFRASGNAIGFHPRGTAASGNMEVGMAVYHANNVVIGVPQATNTFDATNLVGACRTDGLLLHDVTNSYVNALLVGCATNAAGRMTNAGCGILLRDIARRGSWHMYIGRNAEAHLHPVFVAGNRNGITLDRASSIEIASGFVGLMPDGTLLGNAGYGIGGSSIQDSRIGNYDSNAAVVVVGSAGYGMDFANCDGFHVFNTRVGAGQSDVQPNQAGGMRFAGSSRVTIGHQSWPAIVAGNGGSGIVFCQESTSNRLAGVFLGTDAGLSVAWTNAGHGILISDSQSTEIDDAVITASGGSGVRIEGAAAVGNRIEDMPDVSIFGNGHKGIELVGGANGGIAAPVITQSGENGISGRHQGHAYSNYTFCLYANSNINLQGFAEGQALLQEVEYEANAEGATAFDFQFTPNQNLYYTVLALDRQDNMSEFSNWAKGGQIQPTPTPSPTPQPTPTPSPTPTPTPTPSAPASPTSVSARFEQRRER